MKINKRLRLIRLTIAIFLLVGCTKKIEAPSQATTTTTTFIEIEEPSKIIHIDGIDDEPLMEYLKKYWSAYETGEDNVFRYWERGNDYPEGTIPGEHWGQYLDFNKTEYYVYWGTNKLTYNWMIDKGYLGDVCYYDYAKKEMTGDCEIGLEEQFGFLKKRFFEEWIKNIKIFSKG